ncbi:hypothetical protein Y032_0017g3378 [Ancylostoma ceylanicum]|uniref:Uncharacterized protein n=1 Tax=Ancylostoma ceylanicum TaxID=53326 RepID=A0A016V6Y5_9BILA|nr:hypothetical protein Y032_0017g3378 [Ancylostoma ceylanicum]
MAGSTVGNGNEALLTYYRDIVRQMMFASEDFEDPIPACIELVLDITKYQMFAIAAERVNELKRAAPRTAKLDEGKEEESDMEEDEIPTISVPETNINRMKSTVESMDFKETAGQLLEMLSPVYEERKKRIASFESEITPEKYFRFTETRQATFRDDFKQVLKKKNDAANLLRWLGAPQCEPVVSFVLAFIGREVVAQFVDAAVAIRNFEDPKLFLNDDRHGHVAGPNEKVPLQVSVMSHPPFRLLIFVHKSATIMKFFVDASDGDVEKTSFLGTTKMPRRIKSTKVRNPQTMVHRKHEKTLKNYGFSVWSAAL